MEEWLEKCLEKEPFILENLSKFLPTDLLTECLIKVGHKIKFDRYEGEITREYLAYLKKIGQWNRYSHCVRIFLRKSREFIGDLITSEDVFNDDVLKDLIIHYTRFNQTLSQEYVQRALQGDASMKATIVMYDPKLQYQINDADVIRYVEKPILDTMYWWNKIKGTSSQGLLFLEPDKWIGRFETGCHREFAIENRWDVPWDYFLTPNRKVSFVNKYWKSIIKNPLAPASLILYIKSLHPECNLPKFDNNVPLNQKFEMLKRWEEKSLQEFYEKVYKPTFDQFSQTVGTKKDKIFSMLQEGKTVKEIASALGVRKQLVYNYKRLFEKGGK
ncbi:MAG: helix-turn-helix domain-containing protein [Candidatus Micrarchaeia archaeon]